MSRILVIEDSSIHQQSARQTLQGHNVAIVGSYDEAYEYLNPVWGNNGWESPYQFDVVLCDLLMPTSKRAMGNKGLALAGQEMPVGFALALMAARSGAKYVAVLSATNHHDHPASAWMDSFESRCGSDEYPPRFTINGATVGFYHEYNAMIPTNGTLCSSCNGAGTNCWTCESTGFAMGKDWGKLLEHLTTTPVS